jgi:FtsP/CotA-like multicopper oxidase with cupredoxin domain
MGPGSNQFSRETAGLPTANAPQAFDLGHGDRFELRIAPVAKQLERATVRMLAYNGTIPGPTLRVAQGSEVEVTVVNDGDLEGTVHWHGLRLENRYDGTTGTQGPIPVGGRYTYRLAFPDPGIYWYHPHIREDYAQEMGLYGNIVVVPSEPDYWPPVNRELTVTLDDILLEDGGIAPFSVSHPTHTAMGRFGNVLLVNGEPEASFAARHGEVVRFYFTNTANTRVFNVGLPQARLKLVGGDSGRYEREVFVDRLLIAPSERLVVDVLFDAVGRLTLEHQTPARTYSLATITVADEQVEPRLGLTFLELRTNADMAAERARTSAYMNAEPQKTLALVAEMDMGEPQPAGGAMVTYVCPMHGDVTSGEPGRCPKCGMKLMAVEVVRALYACPMHPEITSATADRCPKCGMKLVPAPLVGNATRHHEPHTGVEHEEHGPEGARDHAHDPSGSAHVQHPPGIEWEDDMIDVNRMTTPANMRWKLIDRGTGAEGTSIDWRFRVGDRVKIRLVNEMDSDHPMHHPFHIHGAGRFLILARDGVPEPNLVWKDTVLVPTGQVVDILLDVTNPGLWMAHCHIAEHHESGMMFSFRVDP